MNTEKKYWLDDPRNIRKMVHALCGLCAVLFAADVFYDKDVHFDFENWLGFYCWFGFVSCLGLVFVAKVMRKLLQREEDYYDR